MQHPESKKSLLMFELQSAKTQMMRLEQVTHNLSLCEACSYSGSKSKMYSRVFNYTEQLPWVSFTFEPCYADEEACKARQDDKSDNRQGSGHGWLQVCSEVAGHEHE